MATINTSNSLVDFLSQTGPDGNIKKAIELGLRKHPVFQVLPFMESNDTSKNQVVQRTSLPAISYMKFNQGIAETKATFKQVKDPLARAEALSFVDERLWKKNGWGPAWRLNQELAYVEAMWQQVETDLFYSDESVDPDKWNGLAVRYGVATQIRDTYGYYLLDGGGTGSDNTSVWLLNFDMNDGVVGAYAKGYSAGLQMEDMGRQRKLDGSGNALYGFESIWTWDVGLSVLHPGAAVRIPNLDVSDYTTGSTADLSSFMAAAMHLIEVDTGNMVFVMNRSTNAELDRQTREDSSRRWTDLVDAFSKPVPSFRGIPILVSDMIVNNEAAVAGTFQTDIKA